MPSQWLKLQLVQPGDFDGRSVYINIEDGELVADISVEYGTVELPPDPEFHRNLAQLLLDAAEHALK